MKDNNGKFISMRHAGAPAKSLTPEAEEYFKTLQGADYPANLISSLPRIANQIAAVRHSRGALARYFESLLVDHRGDRRGFEFAVLVEIQHLYDLLVGIPSGLSKTDRFLQGQGKK